MLGETPIRARSAAEPSTRNKRRSSEPLAWFTVPNDRGGMLMRSARQRQEYSDTFDITRTRTFFTFVLRYYFQDRSGCAMKTLNDLLRRRRIRLASTQEMK